jgi:integrase
MTKPIAIPQLINGRGTLPISRSYKGIGLIRLASGTTDAKTYVRVVQAMDDLYAQGKLNVLQELKDGTVSPLQLLSAVTQKGVSNIGTLMNAGPLKTTMTEWLKTHAVKETTRKSYGHALTQFLKYATNAQLVRDIPSVLKKYKRHCQTTKHHKMMEVVRMICLAFARSEYGKNSDLYKAIEDIQQLPRIKKLQNAAVTVSDIKLLMKCLPDHHAKTAWGMCVTGMRISEFFELSDATWEVKKDRIIVNGSKNSNSLRTIFKPSDDVTKPESGELAFRRALSKARDNKKAAGLTLITPHTFRKCFSRWMEAAGILPSHQQMYMGHNAQTMTDFYKQHNVTPYLVADGTLFDTYVKSEGKTKVNTMIGKFFTFGPTSPPKKKANSHK